MSVEPCTSKKCRGRPATFDRDQLILQVMELFWERGYNNLSLSGIAKATGLTRASLYNAFETKEILFLEAMKRYLADSPMRLLQNIGEEDQVGTLLHQFFEEISRQLASDEKSRGCLTVNCFSELKCGNPILAQQLEKIYGKQEKQFEVLIRHAIKTKELPQETVPQRTAAILQAFLSGFALYSKSGGSQSQLQEMAASFLNSIGFHKKE